MHAYGYLADLALYPVELRSYLDRGGAVAWGIVPNNQEIDAVDPAGLAQQLRDGMALICEKAALRGVSIRPDEFDTRSLITPACGLAPLATGEATARALELLAELSKAIRKRYL